MIQTYGRHHHDAVSSELPYFFDKRMIHEVGSSNAKINNIDFLQDGIVECIEEPRRVRYLVICEDTKDVKFSIGRETQTIFTGGNNASHESSMSKSIF